MVEMEKNMRLALQRTVKQNLLESKYTDEPVSYEQALVTYHYLQNQILDQERYLERNEVVQTTNNQADRGNARNQADTQSPAKQAISHIQERAQRHESDSPGNRAVQF